MYKLIIVDDEYAVRRGLRDFINWKDIGFEVIEIFEDGKDAFEFTKKHHVDVVLTDIEMAEVNGIELQRLLRENNYKGKIVVLTGYRTFEYAQQSLKYGTSDYILKPVENIEIVETFKKLKTELDKNSDEEERLASQTQSLYKMKKRIKKQIIHDVMMGGITKEQLHKQIIDMNLSFNENDNGVIVADIRINNLAELLSGKWMGGKEEFYTLITDMLSGDKSVNEPIAIVRKNGDIMVVVIAFVDDNLNSEQVYMKDFLNKIQSSVFSLSGIDMKILDIKAYQSLSSILEKSFETDAMIGGINQFMQNDIQTDDSISYLINAINTAFSEKKIDETMSRFEILAKKLKKQPLEIIKESYSNLLEALLFNCTSNPHSVDIMLGGLKACENEHDLFLYTENAISQLKNAIEGDSQHSDLLMQQALQYIKEHYNEDISRDDVAEHVYLNSSYFSRCFKQCTGMKFVDYLTDLRVKNACKYLLIYGNKISEVSNMVGYNSPAYFARVFKNIMGIAPVEYVRANIEVIKLNESKQQEI